jgi:hypothetical protein
LEQLSCFRFSEIQILEIYLGRFIPKMLFFVKVFWEWGLGGQMHNATGFLKKKGIRIPAANRWVFLLLTPSTWPVMRQF